MLHVLLIHFNILSLLQLRGKRDGTLKEPTETAKIANIATQGNTILCSLLRTSKTEISVPI